MNAILKFLWKVLVLLAIAAFVVFIWPGPWLKNTSMPAAPVVPAAVCPTVVAQVCPQVPAATAEPDVLFGPEMHFPGTAKGPAIAELWNPNTGFCAVVRVNQGEELQWQYKGSWFQAPNVPALDGRWPSYLAEFFAKPSNVANACKVFTSANDVPQQ